MSVLLVVVLLRFVNYCNIKFELDGDLFQIEYVFTIFFQLMQYRLQIVGKVAFFKI